MLVLGKEPAGVGLNELAMLPRQILPNRFYLITRRCTQRQFLLRPDPETNNAFVYCLAEAAQRFTVDVLLTTAMSNHHHTVIFDRYGRVCEFVEHFHKMFAKCQNALRGRWENLWASEQVCIVHLVGENDVLDKLVYTATNPVKDFLVEKVHHWPGVNGFGALMANRPLAARRPRHFFRDDGLMPETVELSLTVPAELGQRDVLVRALRTRVSDTEAEYAALRASTGRLVLGRARVLRQSWRDSPSSPEPRRNLRPRVACHNKWARVEALQRNRDFVDDYCSARRAWLAGVPTVFPAGTYWLRRFAGVPIADTN